MSATEQAIVARLKRARERQARLDKHHKYWRKIWRSALLNMPARRSVKKNRIWNLVDGETTLPEFIKGRAKGKMQIVDGLVFKLTITTSENYYGQQNALARALGIFFETGIRAGKPNHMWVGSSMQRGCEPRDPDRRNLLLTLASERGQEVATEIVSKWPNANKYWVDRGNGYKPLILVK